MLLKRRKKDDVGSGVLKRTFRGRGDVLKYVFRVCGDVLKYGFLVPSAWERK